MNFSLIFLFLSVLHIAILFFFPQVFLLVLVSKLIPIQYLIFYVAKWAKNGRSGNGIFLWGLVFSLGGDLLLGLGGNLQNSFIFGLGSFLIAQILYSIAFSKGARWEPVKAIPFYMGGFAIFVYLYPALQKDLLIPVFIYMFALTTMGWRASARNAVKDAVLFSTFGAISFLLSDALIAFTKFKNLPLPYPQVWIMVTYYLAQYLLVRGFTK